MKGYQGGLHALLLLSLGQSAVLSTPAQAEAPSPCRNAFAFLGYPSSRQSPFENSAFIRPVRGKGNAPTPLATAIASERPLALGFPAMPFPAGGPSSHTAAEPAPKGTVGSNSSMPSLGASGAGASAPFAAAAATPDRSLTALKSTAAAELGAQSASAGAAENSPSLGELPTSSSVAPLKPWSSASAPVKTDPNAYLPVKRVERSGAAEPRNSLSGTTSVPRRIADSDASAASKAPTVAAQSASLSGLPTLAQSVSSSPGSDPFFKPSARKASSKTMTNAVEKKAVAKAGAKASDKDSSGLRAKGKKRPLVAADAVARDRKGRQIARHGESFQALVKVHQGKSKQQAAVAVVALLKQWRDSHGLTEADMVIDNPAADASIRLHMRWDVQAELKHDAEIQRLVAITPGERPDTVALKATIPSLSL